MILYGIILEIKEIKKLSSLDLRSLVTKSLVLPFLHCSAFSNEVKLNKDGKVKDMRLEAV